jgi:hypothetical protein
MAGVVDVETPCWRLRNVSIIGDPSMALYHLRIEKHRISFL